MSLPSASLFGSGLFSPQKSVSVSMFRFVSCACANIRVLAAKMKEQKKISSNTHRGVAALSRLPACGD